MEIFLEYLGYLLLWVAVDHGREGESEINLFSSEWWVVLILIITGVNLIN